MKATVKWYCHKCEHVFESSLYETYSCPNVLEADSDDIELCGSGDIEIYDNVFPPEDDENI